MNSVEGIILNLSSNMSLDNLPPFKIYGLITVNFSDWYNNNNRMIFWARIHKFYRKV